MDESKVPEGRIMPVEVQPPSELRETRDDCGAAIQSFTRILDEQLRETRDDCGAAIQSFTRILEEQLRETRDDCGSAIQSFTRILDALEVRVQALEMTAHCGGEVSE